MSQKPMPEGGWWPAWRYGPNGEAEIFQAEADVPEGWQNHPSKFGENLDQPPPEAPEKLTLTRAEILAELKNRGAPVDVKLTSKVLYDQLVELIDRET